MRSRMIWFAFFVVVIDAMGIGLLMPVLPDILEELTGGDISQTAQVAMALTVVYAGMQFLFGPLIGSLSDRFGRRPVLLLSIGALGLDYILLAIAPTVFLLFIGRIIAGIAGATQSTAVAVAADLSDGENRAKTMGLVFAGFGLGFIIGPALGGLLGWLGTEQPAFLGPQLQAFFGQLGNRAPMYMAALLSLANFAFGFFVFKESLPLKNRRPFSLLRRKPAGCNLVDPALARDFPAARRDLFVWCRTGGLPGGMELFCPRRGWMERWPSGAVADHRRDRLFRRSSRFGGAIDQALW